MGVSDAMGTTIRDMMLASPLPLGPHDTAEYALGLLMELRVRHFPVVDADGFLLGIVSEEHILESAAGPDAEIASVPDLAPLSVPPDAHLFEAAKILVGHDLTTLPIVDETGRYEGLIRRNDLFEQFAAMLSTQESGAIVALEEDPDSYSLSQLVHAIEQNDIRILSIVCERPRTPGGKVRVTLKLNVQSASRVQHLLEHYGYHVVAVFSDDSVDEEMQWRAEEFLRYLEA